MKKSALSITSSFKLVMYAVVVFTLWVTALLAHAGSFTPQNDSPSDGDYRSTGSANWNLTSTWQTNIGGSWGTPSSFPTTGHRTDILTNHVVTTAGNATTINEVVVDPGGTLNFAGKTAFTLSAAGLSTPDLDIYGTVNCQSITALVISSGSPTIVVESGGNLNLTKKTGIYLNSSESPAITIMGTCAISDNSCMAINAGTPTIVITNGGVLNVSKGSGFGVSAGNPTISVNNGGTLTASYKTAIIDNASSGSTITVNVNNGGVIDDLSSSTGTVFDQNSGHVTMTVNGGGTYLMDVTNNSAAFPVATWNDNSTAIVTNAPKGTMAGFNQNFYDLIWNCFNQSASADGDNPAAMTVRHNFTIQSANGQAVKNFPGSGSLSIGGDLAVTNATFNMCGSGVAGGTLSVTGNVSMASGAVWDVTGSVTSPVKINFVGGGSHTFYQGGTINNATRYAWLVDSGNTVTLSGGNLTINAGATVSAFTNNGTLILGANAITGSGRFIAGPGSTTKLGAAIGFDTNSTANIQTPAITNVIDPTANFEFNGSVAQVSGTNFPVTVNNLTINNSAGVQLSTAVTANGTLGLTSGTLDLGGNNLSAEQLSGSGTVSNGVGSATLTNGSSGGSSTFGGTLTDGGGGGGGTLGLTKAGSGKLTLITSESHHGCTLINNGTLELHGPVGISNSPSIKLAASTSTLDVSGVSGGFTLASGQTLSGIGVVTGSVTSASGSIVPGNSPGTLTFSNNLTLNSTTTNYFEVTNAPGPSDEIVVAGTLTAGTSVIDITVLGASLNPGTNTLFHYGSLSGTFNSSWWLMELLVEQLRYNMTASTKT